MLFDARDESLPRHIDTDVCIIGAGAAGITLARELIGQRLRVALLESGGFNFDPDIQSLYRGQITGREYPPLTAARLRFFGGSTNHFGGVCHVLDPIDFERRAWLPGSGWPFGRETLDPYYRRAQAVFQIAPFGFSPEEWSRRSGYPRFDQGAKRITTKIWQSHPLRFGPVYREELTSAPNISVYIYATGLQFHLARDGGRVERLSVIAPPGRRLSVAARVYVLATGGIENARMLLASNDLNSRGLGNQYDHVGRYFMEHLVVHTAARMTPIPDSPARRDLYVSAELEGRYFRGAVAPVASEARKHRIQSVTFFFQQHNPSTGRGALRQLWDELRHGDLPKDTGESVANIFGGLDDRIDQGWRRVFGAKRGIFNNLHRFEPGALMAVVEQAPNPDSRITLSPERDRFGMNRVRLHWKLSRSDKRSLLKAVEIVGADLARLGVGRLRIPLSPDYGTWPSDLSRHFHHMGTTRMDNNPRRGVVDGDCKVHGVSNLYVAGSSVYPTVGTPPPTFTIVALALRMADHFKKVWA